MIVAIILCYLLGYGSLAMLIGLCVIEVSVDNDRELFYCKNPYYFSIISLRERTDLNAFGVFLMMIIHFIINPLYCLLRTLWYIVLTVIDFIYNITHE